MHIKICLFFLGFSAFACDANSELKLNQVKYIESSYKSSFNKSFVNKEFKFLNNGDTVIFNLRLPYDSSNNAIMYDGLFYSCQLIKDSLYSFTLKKADLNMIPSEWNSYYRSNAVFSDKKQKPKFKETKRDTKYSYRGNYGKFVDIDNELYEIILLSPALNCEFEH